MERNTKQREAIRRVFDQNEHPMANIEVLKEAQKEVPGLGIATVYRNLKALVDEGWLIRIETPGNTTYYERSGKAHHHHFLCRKCDKLFEVEDCPGSLKHLTPKGFILEGHEILLHGLCNACK